MSVQRSNGNFAGTTHGYAGLDGSAGNNASPRGGAMRTVADGVVQTGTVETRYYRAGTGPAVLLLSRCAADDPSAETLFSALAAGCRVTAPVLPCAVRNARRGPQAISVSGWLRDFMDVVGLERASIVADGVLGTQTLAFAAAEHDRVDRIVLVNHDAPDPLVAGATREDTLRRSGHPLLIVRLNPASAEEVTNAAAILTFLTAERSGERGTSP